MAVTSAVERQLKEYQRRIVRTLALISVAIVLLVIGIGYVTTSLAKFLEASYGLFALTLMGLIFILLAIVVLLLARQRS